MDPWYRNERNWVETFADQRLKEEGGWGEQMSSKLLARHIFGRKQLKLKTISKNKQGFIGQRKCSKSNLIFE